MKTNRRADWQSAASPIGTRRDVARLRRVRACRMSFGDTAHWQCALRRGRLVALPFGMVLLPAAGTPSASAVTNVLFSPDPGAYRVLKEQLSLTTSAWTNSPSGRTNPIFVPGTLPTKFYRLFKP